MSPKSLRKPAKEIGRVSLPESASALRLGSRSLKHLGFLCSLLFILALIHGPLARPTRSAQTFTISGQVTDGFGHSIGGATVTLSGAQTGTTTTDSVGNYTFSSLQAGNYHVGASLPGRQDTLTFVADVNNLNADTTKNLQILFFVTFQVSVRDTSGVGLGSVGIRINNETVVFAQTNSFGKANIGINVPITGDGPTVTFTPEKPGFVFSPPSVTLSTQSGGQVVNFTGTTTGLPISFFQFSTSAGYVVGEADGAVTITVTRTGDTSNAASVSYSTADTARANQKSDYIMAAGTLNFAPGEPSKTFQVLIIDNAFPEGAHDFLVQLSNPTGGASLGSGRVGSGVIIDNDTVAPTTNPLDNPAFFVGEQYYDFLNRQPDPSGDAFWTNEITLCGNDPQCIERKRINVSAAFYLSIEFQQTGYLVERIYKAAYGDTSGASTNGGPHQLPVPIVRLNEFMADTQQIGLGVIVGQTGWEQALENNKQAFAAEFVQRSRFTTSFPNSMTSAQFVDQLNVNIGNLLSPAARNQLATSGMTRAEIVRAVAENQDLVNAESNRAFVLMQYFGYLRRNPNDQPDADYTGYDFWLTKLNQFNGNFEQAEMVKAFITSTEYRQRFGL
jgi:hypothetical protein